MWKITGFFYENKLLCPRKNTESFKIKLRKVFTLYKKKKKKKLRKSSYEKYLKTLHKMESKLNLVQKAVHKINYCHCK